MAAEWTECTGATGPALRVVELISRARRDEYPAGGCCALGDTVPGSVVWTFAPAAGGAGGGVCTFFPAVPGIRGKHSPGATSGKVDPRLRLDFFVDLYDFSCLNGWTMGNIAAAPKDVALFYHDLANGRLVSPTSLAQMMDWKPFSAGNIDPPAGTQYGLGVFAQQLVFTVTEPAQHDSSDVSSSAAAVHSSASVSDDDVG